MFEVGDLPDFITIKLRNTLMNTKNVTAIFIILAYYILALGNLSAQDSSSKISGKVYFEYFMPDDSVGDVEQFRFKRYYFTYDRKISDDFDVRYRLDADRTDDGKARPFLKHAYISWANLVPDAKIYFGMQPTPNWEISEEYWGYRSIEKTIQDLNKSGASADLGIGLKGKFSGKQGYHITYMNGTSNSKPENDDFKKISGLYWFKPREKFIGTVYLAREPTGSDFSNLTFTIFGGYESKELRTGIEYFKHKKGGKKNINITGISFFGTYKTEKGNFFGRYDISDPNDTIDSDSETYLILGYDYEADAKFHIMPNLRFLSGDNKESINEMHVNIEFKF